MGTLTVSVLFEVEFAFLNNLLFECVACIKVFAELGCHKCCLTDIHTTEDRTEMQKEVASNITEHPILVTSRCMDLQ